MSSATLVVYRCSDCGATDTTLGGIHGHIERHRPVWRIYKIGDPEFLYEHTERYEIPLEGAAKYRTDPRGEPALNGIEAQLAAADVDADEVAAAIDGDDGEGR